MNHDTQPAILAYPYRLTHHQTPRYLLWVDGGKERDYLLRHHSGQLIVAATLQALQQLKLETAELTIAWHDVSELDLDLFWQRLGNLRAGRATSSATNNLINNAWNLFEDLAHTYELPRDLAIFCEPRLQKVYEKFYWGCNLPALTPSGKSYAPIWQSDELSELRRAIKQLWLGILEKAPELA